MLEMHAIVLQQTVGRKIWRIYLMIDIARQFLDIAFHGLKARARLDSSGTDERGFLSPLKTILKTEQTNADLMLAAFDGEWQGDIHKIFVHHDF